MFRDLVKLAREVKRDGQPAIKNLRIREELAAIEAQLMSLTYRCGGSGRVCGTRAVPRPFARNHRTGPRRHRRAEKQVAAANGDRRNTGHCRIRRGQRSLVRRRLGADCAGLHLGGIGFTWEHDTHIYMKRAMHDWAWLGSPSRHRLRAADLAGW